MNEIKECSNRYENINIKSGTLDVFYYCKLGKGFKKCPNLECPCFFSDTIKYQNEDTVIRR